MTELARVDNSVHNSINLRCDFSPRSLPARFLPARATGPVARSPSVVGDGAFLLHGGRGFGLPLKFCARRKPGSNPTRDRTDPFHVRKHGAFDEQGLTKGVQGVACGHG